MRASWFWLPAAAMALVAIVVGTVIHDPLLFLGAGVGIAAVALMQYPVGRLALFVLGGLAAMGGTSGLGPVKLAYAAVAIVCFVIAWFRLNKRRIHPEWRQPVRMARIASTALLALTALGAGVGLAQQYPLAFIGQDAFTYLLIAFAPVIGLDAASGSFSRFKVMTVVVGSVAAVSWAVWWLARRGSSVGGLERLTLVTSFLGFAVFAIALVLAVNASRTSARLGWVLLAVAVPVIYIASGSRSMIVYALGLVGLLGARRYGRLPVVRGLFVALLIGMIALVLLPLIIEALPDGPRIMRRFTDTFALLVDSGIEGDGSFVERSRAYEYTADLFSASPLLGQGLGYIYPSVSGETAGDLKVDSPLLVLSKFGVLGAAAVITLGIAAWRLARATRGPEQLRLGETVLIVFAFITLGRLLFVAPTEDKGFAYAIAMMVCFSAFAWQQSSEFRTEVGPVEEGAPRMSTRAHQS